jgi:hypothetical protein
VGLQLLLRMTLAVPCVIAILSCFFFGFFFFEFVIR